MADDKPVLDGEQAADDAHEHARGADVEHEHPHADDHEHVHGDDHEHEDDIEPNPDEVLKERLRAGLQVETEDVGTLRKRLCITVPADVIQAERDREYSELYREAPVPGFRKGRAPRKLVEKRFAGEVGEKVQTRIVTTAYSVAAEMRELKALGDPQFWTRIGDGEQLLDFDKALPHLKLPDDGPMSFRCEIELWPKITLPELKGIRIERPKIEITDDDVSEQIRRILSLRGEFAPLADGRVEKDDMVIADLTIAVDGQPPHSAENAVLHARGQRIEGIPIENLGDALLGAAAGETRTVEADVPAEHARNEWRGKRASFTIRIHEIKRFVAPPLDETTLRSMGYENEAEMRETVRRFMERDLNHTIKRAMHDQIRKYLLEKTQIDLPQDASRRHIDRAVIRRVIELRRDGVPQEEIDKHADELKAGVASEAINDMKLYFMLDEITENLKISVSEEELNDQIAAIARRYNRRFDRVRDELAAGDGLTALYLEIRDEKCLDRLLEDAEIVETAGPSRPEATPADAT